MDTTLTGHALERSDDGSEGGAWALSVAWCEEPERVGEVIVLPRAASLIIGRGKTRVDDPHPRAELVQQRPGVSLRRPHLTSQRISRVQLRVKATGTGIDVETLGRCPTFVNGKLVSGKAKLEEGDTVRMEGALVLRCTRRPWELPPLRDASLGSAPFGMPDELGIVGESPAAWTLRDRIAFIAPAPGHVLLTGQSGVGKELVARALHACSTRSHAPVVSRNAATLPPGIIDAELFGHAANYPNPGTPERQGIIGQAHEGTLFLDEIGELPSALQAHLLRVLDLGGEYQRLGESTPSYSDFRLVAATNRREDELKSDLAARFKMRLEVAPLAERADDVPLLLLHLARLAAKSDKRVADRFVGEGGPRLADKLVDAFVRHHFTLNVRELDNLLWTAITESTGDTIKLTKGVKGRLRHTRAHTDPSELTREAIENALVASDHNRERAYRLLNLKNRDVLYRLLKKHGLLERNS